MDFKDKIKTIGIGRGRDRSAEREFLSGVQRVQALEREGVKHNAVVVPDETRPRYAGAHIEHDDGRIDAVATPLPARMRMSLSQEE